METNDLRERLKTLAGIYSMEGGLKGGPNMKKFAEMIGVNQQTFSDHKNGRRGISLTTITKILSTFPEISAEWLIRGTGSPTGDDDMIPRSRYDEIVEQNKRLLETIDNLNLTIRMLREEKGEQAAG